MAARASVIIPTFDDAPFVRWAVASAQAQTVREIEICVICDGSPPRVVSLLEGLAQQDKRIRIFTFPKGARHGEAYRHEVISKETDGDLVCYLSHDDLYLPGHVESLERALGTHDFVHSILVSVVTDDAAGRKQIGIHYVCISDLAAPYFSSSLLDWPRLNGAGFGLSFAAHTRRAYMRLSEGWSPAPPDINTDIFMWQKFVRNKWCRAASQMEITALHFDRAYVRAHWSPAERDEELAWWFPRSQEPGFCETITTLALHWLARDVASAKEAAAAGSPGSPPPARPVRPTRLSRLAPELWAVWKSGLFDATWYLVKNPDVRALGVSPLWHFVRWGGPEGRSPGPGFDSASYRRAYPGLPAEINPLTHYERQGKPLGYLPLPNKETEV